MLKRNSLFVITLIVITIFTSCKKSVQENPAASNKVFFYENLPNNSDGLIAEVQLSKENANAFIYGTSDSIGSPAHIKSMAYKINNNDTVYNFVFDNLNRIKIVYAKLNNNNLNQLIKFDYLTDDTVITNIYEYNWITQTDSLLYQFKGKGSDQTKTYGASFSLSNLFKGDANAIVTSFIIVGLVYAGLPVAVYAAGVWIASSTTLGIFGGALTAITLVASTAGAQEYQPIKNPNAPISPTSGFVPNPIGTPSNPTGNPDHYFIGKWNLVDASGLGINYNDRYFLKSDHTFIGGYDSTFNTYSVSGNWSITNNQLSVNPNTYQIISQNNNTEFLARRISPWYDSTVYFRKY